MTSRLLSQVRLGHSLRRSPERYEREFRYQGDHPTLFPDMQTLFRTEIQLFTDVLRNHKLKLFLRLSLPSQHIPSSSQSMSSHQTRGANPVVPFPRFALQSLCRERKNFSLYLTTPDLW